MAQAPQVWCCDDARGLVPAGLALLPGRSGLPAGLDRPLPAPGVPGRCRGFIAGCWPRPLSCGGPGGLLSLLCALRACLHGDGLCCYPGFAVISSSPPSLGEDQPLPTSHGSPHPPPSPLPPCPLSSRDTLQPPHAPLGSAKLSLSRHRIPAAGRDQPRPLRCQPRAGLPVHRPRGSLCSGSLPGLLRAGGPGRCSPVPAPGLQCSGLLGLLINHPQGGRDGDGPARLSCPRRQRVHGEKGNKRFCLGGGGWRA